MAQHKIQSSTGLTLELEQVPKMLGKLTQEWAPRSFVVSFKLETDESILFDKAWGAIEKYHVHLVVANILHTRADKCYLVTPFDCNRTYTAADNVRIDTVNKDYESSVVQQRVVQTILRDPKHRQIETVLVREVAAAYRNWRQQQPTASATAHKAGNDNRSVAHVQEQMRAYVDLLTYGIIPQAITGTAKTAAKGDTTACNASCGNCRCGVFSMHSLAMLAGVGMIFAFGYAAGRAKL